MNASYFLVLAIAAMAMPVAIRCLCIVHRMSRRRHSGPHWHFVSLGVSFVLIATGALAACLMQFQVATSLLLAGLAGLVIFDRRKMLCLVLECGTGFLTSREKL